MKPLIGLNMNQEGGKYVLLHTYADAVVQSGGIPVFLPPVASLDDLDQVLEGLDGLVLTGGGDIDPARYGQPPHSSMRPVPQPKHDCDFQLAARALELGIPTLGVCYGMQLLAVIHGGTLVQDIAATVKGALDHWGNGKTDGEHPARVVEGTRVHRVLGCAGLTVNSHHHQSVLDPGSLVVSARSEDGIIEAVERSGDGAAFVVGVQWHPERMKNRPAALAPYRALIDAALVYREGTGADVSIVG